MAAVDHRCVLLVSVLTFFAVNEALWSKEPGVTYQGQLLRKGQPADGPYDLRFSLYDDPNLGMGNLIVAAQEFSEVGVRHGVFTVLLDLRPEDLGGEPRWLEIAVRPSNTGLPFETLDPRQPVTATPYALYALRGPYTGKSPVFVDNVQNEIGLNPATNANDLMTWNGQHWVARPLSSQTQLFNNMQPYLGVNFIIALQGVYPSRSSIHDPTLAEITMFGGNFAPRSWALCNGQLLSISSNSALFSLLGTTYGGDGRTNFALPDLRGRVPLHPGTGPGLSFRRLGEKGGTEQTGP